ncbi:MAG: hypothetical protein RLZZ515_1925 [Cyanobacteriota bacterium]|jgi:hypothetical protein
MPTQPSNDNPCDPVAQQQRQRDLDRLYRAAGRGRKKHPLYGLYTGLYQEWIQANNAN